MGPRINALIAVAVLLIGLAAPAAASGESSATPTLQGIVQEVNLLLQPVARQRHLSIRTEVPGTTPVLSSDVERMRERVINLIANGIAMSPNHGELIVRYAPESQHLTVWVGNERVALSLERDIRDQAGNAFRLRSVAGKGTELSTLLQETTVGRYP